MSDVQATQLGALSESQLEDLLCAIQAEFVRRGRRLPRIAALACVVDEAGQLVPGRIERLPKDRGAR